ncbi:family 1 glycosylhydrolase [Streptomyces sp. NPDC005373]|uniref:family 1 glycosylhydrolase n=1 Tax=Streptomyces sp. NPDC005373 TaxID=3156879 RepID=UPI0033BDD48C
MDKSTFLWGAATAPHQIEGNNVNSDWWAREGQMPGMERSGDAVDSYHRYEEDMRLLADAGLTAYRFGVEWARVEPVPGHFSRAALAHYRRMIDTARGHGLTPVITLHHFTNPRWFAEEGGWFGERAVDRFVSYVEQVTGILDDVPYVVTVNEPNMLAMMLTIERQMRKHPHRQLAEPDRGQRLTPQAARAGPGDRCRARQGAPRRPRHRAGPHRRGGRLECGQPRVRRARRRRGEAARAGAHLGGPVPGGRAG